MTGWGQEGPYAAQAGHDITYVAIAGALGALGPAGGPPTVPLNLVGDFAGALYLVAGLLAALHESRESGVGQVVDAAMVDSTAHLMTVFHGLLAGGAWLDRPGANLLDGSAPFYGVYRTSDDRWLAVGPLEQPFYDEFVDRLGLAPGAADRSEPANWPDLHDLFATVLGSRTQADWVAVFAGSDACVAPVASFAEAHRDPHLAARGTFVEHHGIVQPAPAPRFSRTVAELHRAPPAAGEHTDEVLADWLQAR
jgi:alpha-methylacyl-CoA racemase